MKNTIMVAIVTALLALASCATTRTAGGLQDAARLTAQNLASILPVGTRVAVMPFDAENDGLSIFLMEELAFALSAMGFEVADRQNLAFVFREQGFQMSGHVSDETFQSIGQMVGAQHIVTGRLWNLGSTRRLAVTATNMETALRSSAPGLDLQNNMALRNMVTTLGTNQPALRPSEIVQSPPRTVGTFIESGLTSLRLGDTGSAILYFSEAIRLSPRNVAAFCNRGRAHSSMGNHAMAIADLTEAIRLDPRSSTGFNNRGLAHYRMGNLNQAIADFEAALRINPNHAYVQSSLAHARQRRGW